MRYEPAVAVARGPQPGAVALRDYARRFGIGDVGIFNNRNVRGSVKTLSLHAEGRAIDFTIGTADVATLTRFLDDLIAEYEHLGIQQVIWLRRSWRCDRQDAPDKWRPYSGVDPHTSHAHLELTRSAADGLTVAVIDSILNPYVPTPPPPPDFGDDDMDYRKTKNIDGTYTYHRVWINPAGDLVRREVSSNWMEWGVLQATAEARAVEITAAAIANISQG